MVEPSVQTNWFISLSPETQDKRCAPMRKTGSDLDGTGSDSAISQAERVKEGEFKDQGLAW